MGIKSDLKQFCQTTTIKGLPRMIRCQGPYLRAMWAICVLFGSAVALYQIIYILSQYFMYETATSMEELEKEPTIFPDVTVCKTNPPPILSEEKDGKLTLNSYIEQIGAYMNESTVAERDILEELYGLDGYFQTITDKHASEFKGNHFIVECIYRFNNGDDSTCSKSKYPLARFLTPSYPSCVSFKPDVFSKRNAIQVLSAIFYVNDFEPVYVPNFGSDATFPQAMGVEIFIHPPNTAPNLKFGIVASPGWETSVRIMDTRRQREINPYSQCKGARYDELDEEEDFIYTETSCRHNCTQLRTIKECNCLDPRAPTLPSQRRRREFCGALRERYTNRHFTKDEILNRMYCLYNDTTRTRDSCDEACVENCLSLKYEYHSMGGMWPHESRQLAFYEKYIQGKDYPADFDVYRHIMNLWKTDEKGSYQMLQKEGLIRRNFLKVKVYFDGRNVMLYKDSPIHTPSSVSGSLGGILNLWIGISFVTAVELMELLYRLFLTIFVRKEEIQDPEAGTGDGNQQQQIQHTTI